MKRIFAVAAIVIAAAVWLYQTQSNGDEAHKRHPASHVIRIIAKLTFDGKPVEIDDLIDCKTTYTGTPTSTPHMTFTADRFQIARETPDGGAIVFSVRRSFCFLYGDTWGSSLDEVTQPESWTPVIEWHDRHDPRQAETGIIYLSETALEAENGRLRVIEPFRIAIPEYPAGEALIAEAARQSDEMADERDLWISVPFRSSRMEWMLRIPENEWRSPERAVLSFDVGRARRSAQPNFSALAAFLDGVEGESGVVVLGYRDDLGSKDVASVIYGLRDGRLPDLNNIYEFGIPKRNAPRHGMLISDKATERERKNPLFPGFFDEYVPFTCIDGVMTPVPETPGLIYWFRDRCSHPNHLKGIYFFGKPVAGDIMRSNDKLVFDLETGDLWWLDKN